MARGKLENMYCGVCGQLMETTYCPNDGWSSATSSKGGPVSSGPTVRLGKGASVGQFTQGPSSPIYNGDLSQITPETHRAEQKPFVRTWKVRLAAWASGLSSLASIIALLAKETASFFSALHPGAPPTPYATLVAGWFGTSAAVPIWLLVVLFVSTAVFILPMAILGSVRLKGYAGGGFGTILVPKEGSLWRVRVAGVCPRAHCGGKLRLSRVTVDTREITRTDSNGNPYKSTVDVKDFRLVCDKNKQDHRYPFDITNMS